jgi:HAMP domain-containing protein
MTLLLIENLVAIGLWLAAVIGLFAGLRATQPPHRRRRAAREGHPVSSN